MEFTKHDVNAEIRKVYVKKPPYTKKANRDTKEHNARTLPSTVTASELGSSKRNILRKGKKGAARKGSTSGLVVDDGSTYDDSYAVLDKNDPNFDSEVCLTI